MHHLLGPKAPDACTLHLAAAQAVSTADVRSRACGYERTHRRSPQRPFFFFFIFFKNKNFKNIYLFWNISKIPTVAPHRATGLKCNFFSSNSQWGPWKKRPCRPPSGDRWAQPTGAAGGPVAPPGDRVMTPYISSTPPLPSSFEPENSTKNPEKREEWGEGKRRNPAGFSTCDLQVSTFSLYIVIFKYYVFKYE